MGLTGNNFKVLRILNFVQKKLIWVAADRFEVKYVMSVVSILLSADSAGVDDASDSVNKGIQPKILSSFIQFNHLHDIPNL